MAALVKGRSWRCQNEGTVEGMDSRTLWTMDLQILSHSAGEVPNNMKDESNTKPEPASRSE